MLRRNILFACVALLATWGCSRSYVVTYDIGLVDALRPPEAEQQYGPSLVRITTELGSRLSHFEDGLVHVVWDPAPSGIAFRLTNRSERLIQIDWERTSYVDKNDAEHRIIHAGVEASQANRAQVPTNIEPGQSISEIIRSADNVSFQSGIHGRWREEPLLPTSGKNLSTLTNEAHGYVGTTVGVVLSFVVDGKPISYRFSFVVDDAVVSEESAAGSNASPDTGFYRLRRAVGGQEPVRA